MRNLILILLVVTAPFAQAQQKGATVTSTGQTAVGKTYALVVGISDYKSEKIPDLKYAENDARAFIDYLKSPSGGSLPDENIVSLLGENANSASIWQNGIAYYLFNKKKLKKGDRLILYFSGHGGSFNNGQNDNAYFFVWDAHDATDGDANLKISQVKDMINMFIADGVQVLFIFDACRSADVGVKGGIQSVNAIVEKPQGEILLVATKGGDVAYESHKLRHGIFTYFLLRGLYGEADESQDKKIMGFELENFIKNKVRSFSNEEFKNFQSPFISWGASNELEEAPLFSYNEATMKERLALFDAADKTTASVSEAKGGSAKSLKVGKNPLVLNFERAISLRRFVSPANNCAKYYYEQIKASTMTNEEKQRAQQTLLTALLSYAREYLNSDLALKNNHVNSLTNTADGEEDLDTLYYDEPVKALAAYLEVCPPEQRNPGAGSGLIYFQARKATLGNLDRTARLGILRQLDAEIKKNPQKAYLYFARGMLLKKLGIGREANLSFQRAREWSPLWKDMNRMIEKLDENEEH